MQHSSVAHRRDGSTYFRMEEPFVVASTPSSLFSADGAAAACTPMHKSSVPYQQQQQLPPSSGSGAALIPSPQKNMTLEELARFRTHICPRKSANNVCALDEHCPYSHCLSWHRRNPLQSGYRPALCPNVIFNIGSDRKMRVKNYCKRGRLCLYSHTKEEQMYHPLVYKTQICRDYPACRKHYCPFAHGESEVRDANTLQQELAIMQQRGGGGTVTSNDNRHNKKERGGRRNRYNPNTNTDSNTTEYTTGEGSSASADWPSYIEAALNFAAVAAAAAASSPNLRRCESDVNQLQHDKAQPIQTQEDAAMLVDMLLHNTCEPDRPPPNTQHSNSGGRKQGDTPLLLPAMPPPLYGHGLQRLLQMAQPVVSQLSPLAVYSDDDEEEDKCSSCSPDKINRYICNSSSATSTTTVGSSSEWTKQQYTRPEAPPSAASFSLCCCRNIEEEEAATRLRRTNHLRRTATVTPPRNTADGSGEGCLMLNTVGGLMPYSLSTVTLVGSDCSRSTDASRSQNRSSSGSKSGGSSSSNSPLSPSSAEIAAPPPPMPQTTVPAYHHLDDSQHIDDRQQQGVEDFGFEETQNDVGFGGDQQHQRRVLLFDKNESDLLGGEPSAAAYNQYLFFDAPPSQHDGNSYFLSRAADKSTDRNSGSGAAAAAALLFPGAATNRPSRRSAAAVCECGKLEGLVFSPDYASSCCVCSEQVPRFSSRSAG